jgi:hypothetical protein
VTRDEELADLKARLKAAQGRSGYGATVEAIKERIAELEATDGD